MVESRLCKKDSTPLIIKKTKPNSSQLLKQYYYTAYYLCPLCHRMYFDDAFKVTNQNYELFTEKNSLVDEKVEVEIWTDGACSRNGTPLAKAAWAFVSGDYEEGGPVEGKQTNNRGEAFAIYHALEWAAQKGYRRIRLHSDSQITLHGVIKHPEKVKENRDIFQKIHDTVVKNKLLIEYKKVLGHSGDINNERADKIATALVM